MPDCQLRKRRRTGWGKERDGKMKEGKGRHERRTITPGRLTSQGFVCCQSGLYSLIDCEGLKKILNRFEIAFWDIGGNSSCKILLKVKEMFSVRVTHVHPWEIWTTKERCLLLFGKALAWGSFLHHRGSNKGERAYFVASSLAVKLTDFL